MTGRAFIAGAVRTMSSARVLIGGIDRRVTRAVAKIGGSTVGILRFLDTLTVSAPDSGGRASSDRAVDVTATLSATPSGGLAPYTYAWSRLSGAAVSFGSPTTASTAAVSPVDPFAVTSAVARVTVTDALGSTVTADPTVTFRNAGGFS